VQAFAAVTVALLSSGMLGIENEVDVIIRNVSNYLAIYRTCN